MCVFMFVIYVPGRDGKIIIHAQDVRLKRKVEFAVIHKPAE